MSDIPENPAIKKALEEDVSDKHMYIQAKTIHTIAIILFIITVILGVVLVFTLSLDGIYGIITFAGSVIVGAIFYLLITVLAEIVYQLQKLNNK